MSSFVPPTDLTKRPPRSPRLRLGGFAILARTLDKGRAKLAGTIGEYHYDCGLDNRLFSFLKIDGPSLYAQIEQGKGDGEILAWIHANAGHKPTPAEIAEWSSAQEAAGPDTPEAREKFVKQVVELAAGRTDDILTGFDKMDLDDFVSYGGKA